MDCLLIIHNWSDGEPVKESPQVVNLKVVNELDNYLCRYITLDIQQSQVRELLFRKDSGYVHLTGAILVKLGQRSDQPRANAAACWNYHRERRV